MTRKFTEKEIEILKQIVIEVDEIYCEDRKGVSQTKYVMQIKPDATYQTEDTDWKLTPVPNELVGFWMMEYAGSLQYDTLDDCIKGDTWVRCEQKEVVVRQWVPVRG